MDSVSGVFVPVEILAHEKGVSADEVIDQIKAGQLTGRQQSDGWHVLVRVPQVAEGSAPAPNPAPSGRVVAEIAGPVTLDGRSDVVVRDVHIELSTMVGLILKFAVALMIAGAMLGGLGFAIMLVIETFGQGLLSTAMEFLGPLLPQ
jgi:hypothetical protein